VAAPTVPERIALVVHPTRPIDGALAKLTGWAAEHGVDVVQLAVDGDRRREVAAPSTLENGDLVVAVGGDGTVLAAMRAAAPSGAPVFGVACGSLGALTVVSAERLVEGLGRVWAGDWRPKSLPALAISEDGAPFEWAANDFVVIRRGAGQLVADITVDDELYVRIAGDGLVVATSMGSSAYSMASGGPVLAAGTAAFVCTPLAMHGGSAPPLVVPGDAAVTVAVRPSFAGYDVEIDGRERKGEGRSFGVTLHPDKLTLVTFAESGRGLTALRKRGLITDSPRVLAREARDGRQAG
jgi:NAD+ kinase